MAHPAAVDKEWMHYNDVGVPIRQMDYFGRSLSPFVSPNQRPLTRPRTKSPATLHFPTGEGASRLHAALFDLDLRFYFSYRIELIFTLYNFSLFNFHFSHFTFVGVFDRTDNQRTRLGTAQLFLHMDAVTEWRFDFTIIDSFFNSKIITWFTLFFNTSPPIFPFILFIYAKLIFFKQQEKQWIMMIAVYRLTK